MALSRNTLKLMNALRQKKYRQKYNKFIVEGDKMAIEILQQDDWKVDQIYALEYWVKTHAALLSLYPGRVNIIDPDELNRVSGMKTPNQVFLIVHIREEAPDLKRLLQTKSLYLDGIQDPGNMGTILRIADWFGLEAVFCSDDCADVYNPKVVQSSMGAFLRVAGVRIDLPQLVRLLPDSPVIGAVLEGNNAFKTKWPDKGILVIGSEGKGISPENEALLTHRMTIPREGGAESLNAGVACGILSALWVNS